MTDAEHVTNERISATGSGVETWQLVLDLRAERDSILTELAEARELTRHYITKHDAVVDDFQAMRERAVKAEAESRRLGDTLFNLEQQGQARIQELEAALREARDAAADAKRTLLSHERRERDSG